MLIRQRRIRRRLRQVLLLRAIHLRMRLLLLHHWLLIWILSHLLLHMLLLLLLLVLLLLFLGILSFLTSFNDFSHVKDLCSSTDCLKTFSTRLHCPEVDQV